MEFSIRDDNKCPQRRSGQDGQAVVEYILVLTVTVAIVLGGVYQLNQAFKVWANNYFGDYLACLLETGDLPLIEGGSGDSGTCNQLYKPFSLADGKPKKLVTVGGGAGGSGGSTTGAGGSGGSGSGSESGRGAGGAREGRGGGSRNGNSYVGRWGPGLKAGKRGKGSRANSGDKDSASGTGDLSNTKIGKIGGLNRDNKKDTRLDTRFAFDQEREVRQQRSLSSSKPIPPDTQTARKMVIHRKDLKKETGAPDGDASMTFGNFFRYLIIAAIVIALMVFFGGQLLQISKADE